MSADASAVPPRSDGLGRLPGSTRGRHALVFDCDFAVSKTRRSVAVLAAAQEFGVDKVPIVDKERNEYHEVVRDLKTGRLIRDKHEPHGRHSRVGWNFRVPSRRPPP